MHATGLCTSIPLLPSAHTPPSSRLITAAANALAWHPQLFDHSTPRHKSQEQRSQAAVAFTSYPTDSIGSAFLVSHPAIVDSSFHLGAVSDQAPSQKAPLKIPSGIGCFMPSHSAATAAAPHSHYSSTVTARAKTPSTASKGSSSMDSRVEGVAVSGGMLSLFCSHSINQNDSFPA